MSDESLLPLFTLRDAALGAGVTLPLFVGRPASQAAIAAAALHGDRLFTVTQRDAGEMQPALAALHEVGTIAEVGKVLKLPDGTWKVELTGLRYARLQAIEPAADHRCARVRDVERATDAERGVPAPKPTAGYPHDVMEEGSFEGFDPEGEPGWSRDRSGTIDVIFEDLPPSWFAGAEPAGLALMKAFDAGITAALQAETLWDNHHSLVIEKPPADAIERLQAFLIEFRARHDAGMRASGADDDTPG